MYSITKKLAGGFIVVGEDEFEFHIRSVWLNDERKELAAHCTIYNKDGFERTTFTSKFPLETDSEVIVDDITHIATLGKCEFSQYRNRIEITDQDGSITILN